MNILAEKTQLYQQFQSAVTELSGNSRLVSTAALGDVVQEILTIKPTPKMVGYDSRYLQSLNFRETINKLVDTDIKWFPAEKPENFDEQEYRTALAGADIALTSADYLIAQTGTAVFLNKNNPSKMISLLPPALIVIASLNSLWPDLTALMKELFASGNDPASAAIFFTGPSRTADIEKILVLGVHGPKELFMIVVED